MDATIDQVAAARPTRARYVIALILFLLATINYGDRATLSIAGAPLSKELGLDPLQMGFVFSAFAWAYVLGQVPGGMLLDRFGSKTVYTASIALWSIFTLLQGFAGLFAVGSVVIALFILRFMLGLAESPAFPANARITASWFPTAERGTASAVFNSAQYFSLVAFAPLMAWLVHGFGWRWVFFVMGGIGILAALVFVRLVQSSPAAEPRVNAAELDYIASGGGLTSIDLEADAAAKPSTVTWSNVRQLLSNRMLLGIYLGQYAINVLTYFFVTWFPIYLVQERHMSILKAGFTAAAPALCGVAGGLLGGVISDHILKRTGSLTVARKAPLLIGMLISSLIVTCNYVDAEWMVVAIMALAFFGKGLASIGWAVIADASPKELIGLTGGIFNAAGNTAGIVTPIVIGLILKDSGSFDGALVFVSAHCLLAIFAYFVLVGKISRVVLKAPVGAK